MNPIFKYLKYIFLAIVLLESCEDNRMENMANDKIYLIKSGIQEARIYNFGSCDYDLAIYKSGYGTDKASLEFLTDPTLLTTYNQTNGTNYLLLPPNCYSVVNSTMNLSAETASDKYRVIFNTTEVLKIMANGDQYMLPLRIKALNNIELKDSKTDILLVPKVSEPYIFFSTPGFPSTALSVSMNDPDEFDLFSKIQTNYKNKWDLNFTIEVDPQALTDYNNEKKTSFKLLPDNAFRMHNDSWSLIAGVSSKEIPLTLVRKNLVNNQGVHLFGEYVLPLRIKTVSKHGIDPVNGIQFLYVSCVPGLLDRTRWEVIEWNSCISEEAKYVSLNRTPDKLLDDNLTTFWGSKWDAPRPMPYLFVFDMKSSKNIFKVGITKPIEASRGNMKSGYFEISDDLKQWTRLTSWELTSNTPRTHVFDVIPAKGRYLRFVITHAFNYFNTKIGPASGAQMDLAEVTVWGLN